jgi:hypothetical protein
LAKQFGVGEEAIAGLEDPDRNPFPPEQAAALRLADAMTRGEGRVPDALFDDLRRRFSEPQIVEIAAVIGLFNYFNRFNNALHMDVTLADPDLLVRRVEQAVRVAGRDVAALCEQVIEILADGRRYGRAAIYSRNGERLVLRAGRGDAPGRLTTAGEGSLQDAVRTGVTLAGESELAVPVLRGRDVVGAICAASRRPRRLDEEDRPLLERIAAILAPALGGPDSGR